MTTTEVSIRPAMINHVIKGLLFLGGTLGLGLLAGQFAFLDEKMQERGVQLGFGTAFGAGAVLCGLATSRNVAALIWRPRLTLNPEGVRLRCWRGVGFTGFFRDVYRMQEHWIPWDDFGKTEAFTHSVNGIPVEQELRIQTTRGLVAFRWDVFSPSVPRIQRTILDYIDEQFRGPKRVTARLPDLQRLRWQQPLQLKFPVVQWWWALLALAAGALAGWQAEAAAGSADWLGFVGFLGVLGGLTLGNMWRQGRRNAVVEFRSDGLALGPSVNALQVIPWADIQFVRPQTSTSVTAGGSGGPAVFNGLELRKRDGSYFNFEGLNGAGYERLHALLEPPLDAVIAAQQRIAHGEAPEAAAQAAGLAPR
ncbi:MAG: hypothetical protein PSW75_10640 [bacterium]|nr:hypothetical protein [bacterium]MDI1335394.1 hypothetical protein [Lacunisphaera sp.]